MAAPYTAGKAGSNASGGHTAAGVGLCKDCKAPATSNTNTRIGDLSTRTVGTGCDTRK